MLGTKEKLTAWPGIQNKQFAKKVWANLLLHSASTSSFLSKMLIAKKYVCFICIKTLQIYDIVVRGSSTTDTKNLLSNKHFFL